MKLSEVNSDISKLFLTDNYKHLPLPAKQYNKEYTELDEANDKIELLQTKIGLLQERDMFRNVCIDDLKSENNKLREDLHRRLTARIKLKFSKGKELINQIKEVRSIPGIGVMNAYRMITKKEEEPKPETT